MNKNRIIALGVVLLVVVGLGFLVHRMDTSKNYSIVYLSTGEVYVGRLSTFPDLQLKDGYVLQMTKDVTDPTKSNFQLDPIKDAIWASKSLHLARQNVIFYGPLSSDSKIAQTLAAQK